MSLNLSPGNTFLLSVKKASVKHVRGLKFTSADSDCKWSNKCIKGLRWCALETIAPHRDALAQNTKTFLRQHVGGAPQKCQADHRVPPVKRRYAVRPVQSAGFAPIGPPVIWWTATRMSAAER